MDMGVRGSKKPAAKNSRCQLVSRFPQFVAYSSYRLTHRGMAAVSPPPLLANGDDRVGSGSPHLFRPLQVVPDLKELLGLPQKPPGRFSVLKNTR